MIMYIFIANENENAFGASIPQSDVSQLANCTTCSFSEDLSNYWTANMWFKALNGTYKRVPQIPNRYLNGETGGMTVYYTSPYDNSKVTAFKPVSICGWMSLRSVCNTKSANERDSVCLLAMQLKEKLVESPNGTRSVFVAITLRISEETTWRRAQTLALTVSVYRTSLVLAASVQLSDSLRKCESFSSCTFVKFLTREINRCWDGKNLDSPDHTSHVSYPASGTFESNGPCPATHPVKLPQLMFEVIWDTTAFNDKALWPQDGSQPFVFSQGDEYVIERP